MSTKTLKIKNLNTLTCMITDKKMKCVIHSLDQHEGKEIDDVYSVGGDIAILSGGNRKIWVKTSPLIGQDVVMVIDEREPPAIPKGKDITIISKRKSE